MTDSSERSQHYEDGPEASSSSSRRGSKGRSSKSSRHPHHRSSGGSSSDHRRKSSALSSPKSSKEKLRLAPAVAASPGAENVSGSAPSSTRKSSKLRQADAVATSNISSGSDQRSEKKSLRQADAVASSERRSSKTDKKKQESRSLTSPGGRSKDKRKSSKFSRDRRTGADASGEIQGPPLAPQEASSRDTAAVALEATAAPNIEDQLEAARQQGRMEGRVEGRNERRDEGQQEDNKPVVVATSLEHTENKSPRKYMYLLVALVIAAIAGGITAWRLLSSNQTSDGLGNPDPTAEDCKAVSEGMEVEGQEELTSKTVDVELNLAMDSNNFNLEVLKEELEAQLQQVALPLLVGCSSEGSISIENNIFLIENAVIMAASISNSTGCSSNTDETVCASFNFQLLLFLGDDTELDQPILDLVADLFQEEGLLELLNLNLATPVKEVNVSKIVRNIPSNVPSSSPSCMGSNSGTPNDDLMIPNDDMPTIERCEAIGNGSPVKGQEDLVVLTYEALLDVALSVQSQLSLVSVDLQTQLQSVIVPALAGCKDEGKPQSGIETGSITGVENIIDGSCLPGSEALCFRYVVHLDLFVASFLSTANLVPVIRDELQKSASVSGLGLGPPFARISFAGIFAQSESESPSANPTTQTPSFEPTVVDSRIPTTKPSSIPSIVPTSSPTPGPRTQEPSLQPTALPSSPPTVSPSLRPTAPPTKPCIGTTLQVRQAVVDWTSANAALKSTVEAQYGPIGGWCFGADMTSMDNVFQYTSTFNEDISAWDVSQVTNMNQMFLGATSFNQDLSSWNVAKVTSMSGMFALAESFNGDLSSWDVSSVTEMHDMFYRATSFNRDISSWNVAKVSSMWGMFADAESFNNNLCAWGSRLPSNTMFLPTFGTGVPMFDSTNCPSNSSPNLSSNPPGPFCHFC